MMFHAGRVLGERRNQISKPSYDCPVMSSEVQENDVVVDVSSFPLHPHIIREKAFNQPNHFQQTRRLEKENVCYPHQRINIACFLLLP